MFLPKPNKLANAILVLLFLLTAAICCQASAEDEPFFRAGAGFSNNTKSGTYTVGLDKPLGSNFFGRIDAGFWTDSEIEHSGSFFTSFGIGKRWGDFEDFHAQLNFGPIFLGSPDILQGSSFAFTEDLTFAYKNIGVGLKHISNAGIVSPNRSRDSVFIQYTWVVW